MDPLPAKPPARTISHQDKWLLGLLFLLAGLTYREIILWNFSSHSRPNYAGWFYNLSDTSPQFLYALALGLFYLRRENIVRAFLAPGAPWSALLFLVPGAALLGWAHYVDSVDILYMSFLLIGFGTARFIAGACLTREILIPFAILVFAIPLPAVLINQIVFPAQIWTAEHSAWLLNAVGIPALLQGSVVVLADHGFSVDESCTALGFVKWLLIFALVFLYLFPARWLHSALLILCAPLIGYSVNLLRALSLILIPGLELLSLHVVQGIVFFMIGFGLLYASDSLLRKFIGKPVRTDSEGNTRGCDGTEVDTKRGLLYAMLAFFALLFLVSLDPPRWSGALQSGSRELDIPEQIGDWEMVSAMPLPHRFLGNIRYTSHLYRFYQRGENMIGLFIGYDDRLNRNRSFLSKKNAYQGGVGVVEDESRVYLDTFDTSAVSILTTNKFGHILSYHWYEGVGSTAKEILWAFLALDQSPLRRPGGALVFRVATNVSPVPWGRESADQRLREFLVILKGELPEDLDVAGSSGQAGE